MWDRPAIQATIYIAIIAIIAIIVRYADITEGM